MTDDLESLSELTPLQRSVVAIGALRARLDAVEAERREPIAILGIGCRFPGADGPDAFWRLLLDGVDAVSEVPTERWSGAAADDAPPHLGYGAFLENVDHFDAPFFGITAREATTMDPQQRLLLEVAIEALEHAAIAPPALEGSRLGIFVGAMTNDYAQILATAPLDVHTVTGVGNCLLAGRLAHILGARGPALTVDTACSSSLVALHLACQSLRMRESDVAIAAGVNLILTPAVSRAEDRAQILSPSRRCRAFDAAADGIVRGEGCGVLVLSRLSDAVARRVPIHAVVRGSAIGHDGRSAGLTVPSEDAQRLVILAALEQARVDPLDVQYLEAHGTGTSLGDPIELGAVRTTLCANRPMDRPLFVGSVKTNLGHLEAAAGIAGLIKCVLSLGHATIPPHLHLRTPNPLVPWNELPVHIPRGATPWPSADGPRTSGVSSFGLSGTNAHVILTEAPPAPAVTPAYQERPLHVLTLSARSEPALRELARRYADRLRGTTRLPVGDVCFTANTGRAHHRERLVVLAADSQSLADRLAAFADGLEAADVAHARTAVERAPVAFVLDGSPHAVAGVRTLRAHAAIASAVDECNRVVASLATPGVAPVLFGAGAILDDVAPLAAMVSEIAVARLWSAWGVRPAAIIGVGPGMWTAAHLAGALSLEAALRLAWRFGAWRSLRDAAAPERELEAAWAALHDAVRVGDVTAAQLPIVSGRTGQMFDGRAATGAQWAALGPDLGSWDVARGTVERLGCRGVFEVAADNEAEPWRGLLEQAARLYLAGAEVDWAAFDAGFDRRVVPLPTYPFERQRYWVAGAAPQRNETAGEAAGEIAGEAAGRPEPVEDECIHEVVWRRARAAANALGAKPGAWLLIGEGGEVVETVRAQLETAGHRVTVAPEVLALCDADAAGGIDPLAAALARSGHGASDPLQGLVYFASAGELDERATPRALCAAQLHGVLTGLRLVQALEQTRAMPRRLCLVTCGSQAVRPAELANPALLPFWAMGATIANEYPHARVSRVDLPANPADDDARSLAACVLGDDPELQIAVREGARYVPRLVRSSPADAPSAPVKFELGADATYLVTGGLGALGLATARWLAAQGARHLVLVSRGRELPAALHVLLEQGISVTVHSADVADVAAMRALFDEIARAHPPLRGIIHAAGVLDDGLLRQQTAERFQRVLRPKVQGAWVLHECSLGLPLDFFVCFSSMAGIIGTPGQGNYVAANAGMDALAAYRRSIGLPAVSVRWGPWAGGGMALAIGVHDPNRLRSIGVRPLAPPFALRVLERVLRNGVRSDPVVVDSTWDTFAAHPGATSLRAFLAELASPAGSTPSPTGEWLERWRAADASSRQSLLRAHVRETVARAMSLEPEALDTAQALLRLGLDSLMAVDVKRSLFTTLSIEIDLTAVLEGASTDDLADAVARLLDDAHTVGRDGPPLARDRPDVVAPPGEIDAATARDLLERLDELSAPERDRLLERLLLEG